MSKWKVRLLACIALGILGAVFHDRDTTVEAPTLRVRGCADTGDGRAVATINGMHVVVRNCAILREAMN